MEEILKVAKVYQNADENIRNQAEYLTKTRNISSIDALHLASAESANADVFITCDYGIIKKYKGRVKVITPLEFVQNYERSNG